MQSVSNKRRDFTKKLHKRETFSEDTGSRESMSKPTVRSACPWSHTIEFTQLWVLCVTACMGHKRHGSCVHTPVCRLRGLAPRYARLTLALRPSMMGLGSLQALSAAPRSAMVTYMRKKNMFFLCDIHTHTHVWTFFHLAVIKSTKEHSGSCTWHRDTQH